MNVFKVSAGGVVPLLAAGQKEIEMCVVVAAFRAKGRD